MISETNRHLPASVSEPTDHADDQASSTGRYRPIGQVLRRRAWIIILVLGVSLAGGYEYLKHVRRMYTASSRLIVQQAGPKILGESSGSATNITPNYLNTQCELIRSLPILALVIAKIDPQHMQTFAGVSDPLMMLKDNLQAEAGKKDDIITVSFDAPSAEEGALIVNTVVEAYRDYSSTKKQSSAGKVLEILGSVRDHRAAELEQRTKALNDFRANGGPVSVDTNRALAMSETWKSLSDAYNSARLARIEAEARGLGEKHPIYQAALLREKQYKAALDDQEAAIDIQRKSATKAEERAADFALLEADMKRSAQQIDLVDARINEVNANDTAGALNIEVTDPAVAKDLPSRPKVARTMLVAGCVGLMLGLLAAFLLDMSDDRLRTIAEVGTLRMPLLAVVPKMGRRNIITSGRVARLEPGSSVAESFRALRAAVEYGPPAKTILITSPTVGEGKSIIASNLSITLASSGYKVLLIDGDLRAPMQHKIWDLPAGAGLAAVIEDGMDITSAIVSTGLNRLGLLTAGEHPANPAGLVDSDLFSTLLSQLRDSYDYIVIDSPPVLLVTDSRLLAATCDVTILVARADKTSHRAVVDARDGLLAFGAGLLGVVFNGGPKRRYGHDGTYGNRQPRMRRPVIHEVPDRGGQLAGSQPVGGQLAGTSLKGAKPAGLLESVSRKD